MIRFLLGWALLVASAGCTTTTTFQGSEVSAGPRTIVPLMDGWRFAYAADWSLADAAESPRDAWEDVLLPHSWNRLGEYRVARTADTDNRQGTGWYRRVIDGRGLDPARRHFLDFGAVGNVADVWLNGRHLARHAGAFTRFRVELTGALDFAGENLVLVRADNSDPQPGSSTQHTIPLLGDFFIHGGIYRPVALVSVAPSHFALDDFGGRGVYVTPEIEPGGDANVRVLLRLSGARTGQSATITVLDSSGSTVGSSRHALRNSQRELHAGIAVVSPRLWRGRADPYLYRVVATLEDAGRPVDRVEQQFGIRSIRFDPNEGFFLNGERLEVRGVSRHQDYLGKGLGAFAGRSQARHGADRGDGREQHSDGALPPG